MKNNILALAAAAALLLCTGCAKDPKTGKNDASKRFFDSWMTINHPNADRMEPGIYIIGDEPGSGSLLGSEEEVPYVYVDYTVRDLSGNITSTSDAATAQQVGTYVEGSYYGPTVLTRGPGALSIGIETMLSTMHKGGSRTAVIPGWLTTTLRRDSEEDYLKEFTGTDAVYSIRLVDEIKDLTKWQVDSVESYMQRMFAASDSLKYGFYMIQTQAPSDTTSFEENAEIEINYSGMLLNGHVFDTTDEKTAKDHGIHSSSKTYGPVNVTLNEDYSQIKLNSSEVIDGFSYCISKMKTGEKATCVFISNLGYGAKSSASIPGYSPLRFDIEVIGTKK